MKGKSIAGYGQKYLVTEGGHVYRKADSGQYVEVSQHGSPPRVRLYRFGKVYHAYVHVLVRRAFGREDA